jgi:hypothetical protein
MDIVAGAERGTLIGLQRSNERFEFFVLPGSGASALPGDVNGDGKVDLVTPNSSGSEARYGIRLQIP